jgi:cephalosporin-C deacetylase-like acetyl esterase
MSRLFVVILILSLGLLSTVSSFLSRGTAVPQSQKPAVVIDGKLSDLFWRDVVPGKLVSVEAGTSPEMGGEVRAVMAGRYLYLSAQLPEPDGYVTARSIGRNPHWEEGEDVLQVVIRVYNENDWMLVVGPFGAYSVKWRWTGETEWYTSRPEKFDRFLVTAATGEKEWTVEVAIPLDQLGSPKAGSVRLTAERIRAMRPGRPEERWHWPDREPTAEVPSARSGNTTQDPVFKTNTLGNSDSSLEVGRSKELPSLDSGWGDLPWRDVPVWRLFRNESSARPPLFPTEIKMMHNGHTLAVMARCAESGDVIATAKERDGSVGQDDSFQVYIATSGSSYVHYAINPLQVVLDATGHSGGPRISRQHVEWNSPVRVMAQKEHGEWLARFDLPLEPIAQILGEAQIPTEWRILLLRFRPGRDGEPEETSVLPVTESVTPICPARYKRLKLVDRAPSQLPSAQVAEADNNLAFAPSCVFSDQQRKEIQLDTMLDRHIRGRVMKILEKERRDWDQVKTVEGWERFRDPRLKALATSLGEFPARTPLQVKVSKEFRGDGYRRQDLVYETRQGLWVPANLYLPAEGKGRMPGLVIAHSLHGPKTQFELQDMGILWARSGCAVLIMDQIGYGERLEHYPWDREAYHSRYVTQMQLYLAGESLMKWMVWDIMRGIDLLLERKDVNERQIILLGAVAGGGDPAAVAAALDSRVSAVVPFNFGESTPEIPRFLPEKNQWPLELADPGLYDWDSTRVLRRSIVDEFLPWMICASVAPRRFVYSYELGWEVDKLPAWARYQKVFGLYSASDHLAEAHGFGPFPGPGECWNIGPAQRRSLHPTLERWFGIPIPFSEMNSATPANLTKVPGDRRPESELAVLNLALASELRMRPVYELALEVGRAKLAAARAQLEILTLQERREWIRTKWAATLGDVEPNRRPEAEVKWTKQLPDARVEAITLGIEKDILVPLLLLRPATVTKGRPAVVVAISEQGKELFLADRSRQIEALLRKGVAVCLPDVRGVGETKPDSRRDPDGSENMQANNELMLGETLLGRRLKDLRSVFAYLQSRQDLDSQRIGVWGDSFVPANPHHMSLDELPQWQVGPDIERQAEPLGGLLAMLGALYEDRVRAVAVRHSLVSYLSILDDRFVYVPQDIIVPGILEVGDLPDVAAALAPRPLLLEGLVDGRNRLVSEATFQQQLEPLFAAYKKTGAAPPAIRVREASESLALAEWFLAHL